MFDAIKKILANAREQHTRTYYALQQKRRELDQLHSTPNARAEIIAATEAAIVDMRATALAQIQERAQHLLLDGTYVPGYKIKSPGAFPVDDRGRPEITHAMLLALLGEPLRQLVRDALADLSEGITSERRQAEVARITHEIGALEAKLQKQSDEAREAGVSL